MHVASCLFLTTTGLWIAKPIIIQRMHLQLPLYPSTNSFNNYKSVQITEHRITGMRQLTAYTAHAYTVKLLH